MSVSVLYYSRCSVLQPVGESRWLGLSAARFAPGWTHEKLGAALFPVAEDVFWSRLAPLLTVSGPSRLPLVTSFCQGRGLRRYTDGKVTTRALSNTICSLNEYNNTHFTP